MTQCFSEGALRAYLDRELPTEDMQRVASHRGDCPPCDGLCTALAARAAHVSALMELLPEWAGAMPRPAVAATRRTRRTNWLAIAGGLAACLALATYVFPSRHPREEAPVLRGLISAPPPPAPAVAALVSASTPLLPEPLEQPAPPAPRRPRRVRQAAPEPAYFVALDDEPFESGVIMRMDVKPGNLQADIVFGPDGHAHAFRLVNTTQRNF